MAIICTNNLLGNDTTGNGSAATPYKTINKAISVAADNDTIKVAGGQFVQVTGTVTTTARGTTMSTSVDMTGSISLYDVIAIDTSSVDGWDKEKTLFTVEGITSTTITVGTNQPIQFKAGTYNIWRLNAYHYSTTATTAQETITTITPSTLTISGGWDATFTTQIGWTCYRYAVAGNSATASFLSISNLVKPNVIFDKFLIAKGTFNATSSNGSIGINTISFVLCSGSFGISNYGIYNPSGTPTTIIFNGSVTGISTSYNGGGNRPDTLLLNQYVTASFTIGNGFIKVGYNSILGANVGPSVRTNNLYCRTSGIGTNLPGSAILPQNTIGDIYIDYLNLTVNGSAIIPIYYGFTNDTAWRYIGNIDVQTDGTTAGITGTYGTLNSPNPIGTFPLNINRTSAKLDALPWRIYGTLTEIDCFYKSTCTVIYGKDIEGYKVIAQDNIPRYADNSTYQTGSNSLRQKLLTNTAGGDTIRHLLGTLVKPTSPFTINITIKGSKNIPSSSTSFSLLYGPAQTQVLTLASNPNITTSWATLSYSVTPASYTNWSFGDDGLMSIFYNASSGATGITDEDYFWVDAITIT